MTIQKLENGSKKERKIRKLLSCLDTHLNTCLVTAVRGEDPNERERVLKEIAEIYETATKV